MAQNNWCTRSHLQDDNWRKKENKITTSDLFLPIGRMESFLPSMSALTSYAAEVDLFCSCGSEAPDETATGDILIKKPAPKAKLRTAHQIKRRISATPRIAEMWERYQMTAEPVIFPHRGLFCSVLPKIMNRDDFRRNFWESDPRWEICHCACADEKLNNCYTGHHTRRHSTADPRVVHTWRLPALSKKSCMREQMRNCDLWF